MHAIIYNALYYYNIIIIYYMCASILIYNMYICIYIYIYAIIIIEPAIHAMIYCTKSPQPAVGCV